jgi:flagellum-specific ATP synthase
LATYRNNEDLINIGAYSRGSNTQIDAAIAMIEDVNRFLCQEVNEQVSYADSVAHLIRMMGEETGDEKV